MKFLVDTAVVAASRELHAPGPVDGAAASSDGWMVSVTPGASVSQALRGAHPLAGTGRGAFPKDWAATRQAIL